MKKVNNFFVHRVLAPIHSLTLSEIFIATFAGIAGGLFPVPGLTTIVTLAICRALQFHAVEATLATSVNFFLTPIELLIVVPFARFAAILTGADTSQFTLNALHQSLKLNVFDALRSSALLFVHSCIFWFFVTVPFLYVLRIFHNSSKKA